jgi:hypothetical protein
MAAWQATNVLTGAVEGPKYIEIGSIDEIWSVALTTALANGDTILGPSMPAGVFFSSATVATDQLDTGGGITFEAGYTSATITGIPAAPAAWIAASSSIAQTGGVVGFNVAAALGQTFTGTVQMTVTITRAATTPKAGIMRLKVTYVASP